MAILSKRIIISVYVSMCPECSNGTVVTGDDVRKDRVWTCNHCGHQARLSMFDVEHIKDIIFKITPSGDILLRT